MSLLPDQKQLVSMVIAVVIGMIVDRAVRHFIEGNCLLCGGRHHHRGGFDYGGGYVMPGWGGRGRSWIGDPPNYSMSVPGQPRQ